MFWLHFAIVFIILIIGARVGGVFLGMAGGLGLAILTFVFHLTPTNPPVDVMLIIFAVVMAASVIQATGGMDYLVQIAEYILRKNPNHITFLGPMVAYIFSFLAGTGYVVFSVLPVIAEVARESGVRPERPMAISAIASQQAITGTPISAATVALLVLLAPLNVSLMNILIISIPASIIGLFAGALYSCKRGKDLDKDPEYLERVSKGLVPPIVKKGNFTITASRNAKVSVVLFVASAILITLFGTFPSLRPLLNYSGKMQPLAMPQTIEIVMLTMAAVMVLVCKADVKKVVTGSVFINGTLGVACIFGVAWLGDTLLANHMDYIKGGIQGMVTAHSWVFAIALFAASVLIHSQAATVRALMPLGIALGIPAPFIIAAFPAVNGYFFLPTYPTLIAGVAFDTTGTTKIGKFVLNHSCMVPGLVTTVVTLLTSYGLAAFM